jgi:hypothetical protein
LVLRLVVVGGRVGGRRAAGVEELHRQRQWGRMIEKIVRLR